MQMSREVAQIDNFMCFVILFAWTEMHGIVLHHINVKEHFCKCQFWYVLVAFESCADCWRVYEQPVIKFLAS